MVAGTSRASSRNNCHGLDERRTGCGRRERGIHFRNISCNIRGHSSVKIVSTIPAKGGLELQSSNHPALVMSVYISLAYSVVARLQQKIAEIFHKPKIGNQR